MPTRPDPLLPRTSVTQLDVVNEEEHVSSLPTSVPDRADRGRRAKPTAPLRTEHGATITGSTPSFAGGLPTNGELGGTVDGDRGAIRTVIWLSGEHDLSTVAASSKVIAEALASDDADVTIELAKSPI